MNKAVITIILAALAGIVDQVMDDEYSYKINKTTSIYWILNPQNRSGLFFI